MSSLVDHVVRSMCNAAIGVFDVELDAEEARPLAIAAINACRQPGKQPQDMAPHEEVECALALFRALKQANGEYRAVKVEAPAFWNIVTPRTQEALLAALETESEPPIGDVSEETLAKIRGYYPGLTGDKAVEYVCTMAELWKCPASFAAHHILTDKRLEAALAIRENAS